MGRCPARTIRVLALGHVWAAFTLALHYFSGSLASTVVLDRHGGSRFLGLEAYHASASNQFRFSDLPRTGASEWGDFAGVCAGAD